MSADAENSWENWQTVGATPVPPPLPELAEAEQDNSWANLQKKWEKNIIWNNFVDNLWLWIVWLGALIFMFTCYQEYNIPKPEVEQWEWEMSVREKRKRDRREERDRIMDEIDRWLRP